MLLEAGAKTEIKPERLFIRGNAYEKEIERSQKRLEEASNHSASLSQSEGRVITLHLRKVRQSIWDNQGKIQPMSRPIYPRNMPPLVSPPRSVVGWEPSMRSKGELL